VAVLSKRVGLPLGQHDVYLNVVGGLRVTEPAIDLAAALAIASSLQEIPVDARTALVGEIGLSGELRSVSHLERRLREARGLGFERAVVPATVRQVPTIPGMTIRKLRSMGEVVQALLVPEPGRERGPRRAEAARPRRTPIMVPPAEELDLDEALDFYGDREEHGEEE
jgi:DNA repair protein RadA/Sms